MASAPSHVIGIAVMAPLPPRAAGLLWAHRCAVHDRRR